MIEQLANDYKKYLDYLISELTAEENKNRNDLLKNAQREIPVISTKIALLTRVVEKPELYDISEEIIDSTTFVRIKPKNLFAYVRMTNIAVRQDQISPEMLSFTDDESMYYIEGDRCMVKVKEITSEVKFTVQRIDNVPDSTQKYLEHIKAFMKDVYPMINYEQVDHKIMGTCLLLTNQTIDSLKKNNFLTRIFSLRWAVTIHEGKLYMFKSM